MDIITHCTDTAALVAELQEKFPDRINIDDPENPSFLIGKAPGTKRNGNETLCLCRVNPQDYLDIESLETITILGTYDEVFADPEKQAIYDRVYDQTPVEVDDGMGGTITYTPSRKFVVIA